MKRARGLTVVAALASLVVLGCGGEESPEEIETSKPAPVVVATARTGSIRAVVRVPGMVTPAPGADLLVTASLPARVAELPHAVGDRVRRGALLVRFEVPSLAAEVDARRADQARGEARLRRARAELERLEGLLERGIAAAREVEDAHREVAEAEADVSSAQGGLAAATALAERAVVRAPFDGMVAQRLHNPGDLVEATASDAVLRFIDPARLQVEAAVPIAELGTIEVGQPARVYGPGWLRPAAATVTALAAAADAATGAAGVRVELEGPLPLPPNTMVEVEILTFEHQGAVIVPVAAMVEEGPSAFVYVVGPDDRVHRRPFEPGIVAGGEVEARSGVAAGDRVVVRGQNALPDGAMVVVSGAPEP